MKDFWIECNCQLIDRKLLEMEINQDSVPARLLFRIDSVESVRESMDEEDKINNDECLVFFKSGESYLIDISYDKLKNKLLKQSDVKANY